MKTNPWLHRFAVFLAAYTLLLLYVGGLVTSTGSGLAVPDWPLSFGGLLPEMVGGVLYEHGHRMVAASVGILTLILAVWLWRKESRPWVRRLGGLTLLAVICQAILGGITVLYLLPTAVSVSHAGLAQVFFSLTVSIAVFTSQGWKDKSEPLEDAGSPSLKLLTVVTTGVIYLQILIGAWMRHTASGLAIPDFPLSYGRIIPPFFTRQIWIHFTHRIGALVVTCLVIWLAVRIVRYYKSQSELYRAALFLLLALAVQILLGALTIWTSRATIPTTLHVAVGGLVLASSLYLTIMANRNLLKQPEAAARSAEAPLGHGVTS